MAHELNRLIADGEQLGFTYLGRGEGGHIKFRHESGQHVFTSFTPSDHRSWLNARSKMERVAGRRLAPTGHAGSYSFKKVERVNLQRSEQEIRDSALIDRLVARADDCRSEFRRLALSQNRANAARARDLLDEFQDIRDELASHHRIIKPIY